MLVYNAVWYVKYFVAFYSKMLQSSHNFRSDLARQYKAKMSEMELKRSEVARMSQDYESKMKTKEVIIFISQNSRLLLQ